MALFTALATVAAIGATAYGAHKSSSAANKATAAATKASDTNNALQRDIYDKNVSLQQPFINQGAQYTGKINSLLATNPFSYEPGNFKESPDYQFRLQQANEGVQQQNAASNTRLSGSAQKAIATLNGNMASQEYGNWWNRDQADIAGRNNVQSAYLNAMQGQQQVGAGAANAVAGVGTNYANATGANNQFAANQVGNAALVGANNTNNLINSGISAGANLLGQSNFGRGSSYGANLSGMDAGGVKMNTWGLW